MMLCDFASKIVPDWLNKVASTPQQGRSEVGGTWSTEKSWEGENQTREGDRVAMG